jgi:hypothetical protein
MGIILAEVDCNYAIFSESIIINHLFISLLE